MNDKTPGGVINYSFIYSKFNRTQITLSPHQMPLKLFFSTLSLFLLSFSVDAQSGFDEKEVSLETESGALYGTLTLPENANQQTPVSLIIAGSGPTDRDGNNPIMTNNSLQMLAHRLAENGIASLRYDKRGIAKSSEAMIQEKDLRFEDYIRDAVDWVKEINSDFELGPLTVVGHSEGSLIGIKVAQEAEVAKFISVAGPAESGDKIIRQQLSDQPAAIKDPSFQILDSLSQGQTVSNVNPMLYSLFRPDIQPYLISWFAYEPQNEISELDIPVLIVQGTTDFQVSEAQGQMLANSAPDARLMIVEGMNHILKQAPEQKTMNAKTYNQPNLPLVDEAVRGMVNFILAP